MKKKLPYGRLIRRGGRNNWYWHYYEGDGVNRTITTGTSDYSRAFKIAKRWAAEHLAEIENIVESQAVVGVSLSEAITQYQVKKVPELAPKYQKVVNGYLDKIEKYFGHQTSVHEIDHKMIDGFPDFLRKQNPKIKPQTINAYLSTFSKLMKMCCRYGYRKQMPFIEKEGKIQRKHGEVYSPEQIQRILEVAREIDQERDDIDQCCMRFIGLGLFCGLRHSEAVAVQWENLDLEKNVGYLVSQKNKSNLPFPLGLMGSYLSNVPKSRRVGHVVQFKYNANSDLRIPVKSLRRTWQHIRERAGLNPDAKYHSLRNTFTQLHFEKYGYDAKHFSRHYSIQAMYTYLQKQNLELLSSKVNLFGEEVIKLLSVD